MFTQNNFRVFQYPERVQEWEEFFENVPEKVEDVQPADRFEWKLPQLRKQKAMAAKQALAALETTEDWQESDQIFTHSGYTPVCQSKHRTSCMFNVMTVRL